MDTWQLLHIAIRRWYVFLPISLAAVVFSYAAAANVAVEYSSQASLLLVNPRPAEAVEAEEGPAPTVALPPVGATVPADTTVPDGEIPEEESTSGNPWLSFSGSLNTAAQAIQLSVSSQEVRTLLYEEGLSPDYTITPDRRNPILVVDAYGSDPVTTQATLERVLVLVSEDLEQRQVSAGASSEDRIRVEVLAIDDSPIRATGAKLRVRLLTLGLGLTAALVASVAFDAVVRRRRATVVAPDGAAAEPAGAEPVGAEPPTPAEAGGPAETTRTDRTAGADRATGIEPMVQHDAATGVGTTTVDPDAVRARELRARLEQVRGPSGEQGFGTWTGRVANGDRMVGTP